MDKSILITGATGKFGKTLVRHFLEKNFLVIATSRSKGKLLDFQGVFSPVYAINSIGSVLTRKGEGLIGINFDLWGNPDTPKVLVNPFSVLTPGMFREIFRRPPPKVELE